MERIDWVEKAALENAKFGIGVTDALAKGAETLLALLLAALGGAVAYLVKALEVGLVWTPLVVGVVALTAWWMLLGGVLMHRCIMSDALHGPCSDPCKLHGAHLDAYSFEQVRAFELARTQERIDANRARNARNAYWLDRCRLAFLASPLIGLGAALARLWA